MEEGLFWRCFYEDWCKKRRFGAHMARIEQVMYRVLGCFLGVFGEIFGKSLEFYENSRNFSVLACRFGHF